MGRIGGMVVAAIYPAITRAEAGSQQFARIAAVTLRGIAWVTIPSAVFLALAAHEFVMLLYGSKWTDVVALLPLAAAQTAMLGISTASYSLLIANQNLKSGLAIDVVSAGSAIALALMIIPLGLETYLAALAIHGAAVTALILFELNRHRGITVAAIAEAFLPPLIAAAAGAAIVWIAKSMEFAPGNTIAVLVIEAIAYALACLVIFRFVAARQLTELLNAAPGGTRLSRALRLA